MGSDNKSRKIERITFKRNALERQCILLFIVGKRRVTIDVTCRIDDANDSDEYDSSFIDDDECNELSLTETESDENFTDYSYDSSSDEDDHDILGGRKKKMLKFSLF